MPVTARLVGQNWWGWRRVESERFHFNIWLFCSERVICWCDYGAIRDFHMSDTNKMYYGEQHMADQLLRGVVKHPPEAQPLMDILNGQGFA